MSIFSRAHRGTLVTVETIADAAKDPNHELWHGIEKIVWTLSHGVAKDLFNRFTRTKAGRDLAHRSGQVEVDPSTGEERIKVIHRHGKAQIAEYVIQEHDAEKAGLHWDFRIVIDGEAHSWVIKRMKMPISGDRPLKAIQQPTHTEAYIDFTGEIPEGYGKGTVKQADRGQMEVLYSDNDNVDFVIYTGRYAGRYKLKRWYYTEDGKSHLHTPEEIPYGMPSNEWLLTTKKDGPHYPPHMDRPSNNYRSVKREFDLDEYIVTEKVDGTHSVLHGDDKRYHRKVIASRRPPKASNKSHKARGGILHQEDNLPWVRDMETAYLFKFLHHIDITQLLRVSGFSYSQLRIIGHRVQDHAIVGIMFELVDFDRFIFHVEVYHDYGHSFTSGLMNCNPIKAREIQAKHGRARVVLIDVRKYQGKDVRNVPYYERRRMMKEFAKYHPEVCLPREPAPGQSHRDFHEELMNEKGEGTIVIHKDQTYGGEVFKVKGHMDADFSAEYYIVGFTEGKGKYEGVGVGAIYYSDTPEGKPLGKAAGMDDDMRRDMYEHPEKYQGKKVVIESRHHIEPGKAVRAPNVVEVQRGVEPDIEG